MGTQWVLCQCWLYKNEKKKKRKVQDGTQTATGAFEAGNLDVDVK